MLLKLGTEIINDLQSSLVPECISDVIGSSKFVDPIVRWIEGKSSRSIDDGVWPV